MNTKGRQPSPMLLGHHSEKVKELWEQVKEKDLFCATYGYGRTFIERTINGKQKKATNRVHNLILDLVKGRNVASSFKAVKPVNYSFLHPKTVI